MSEAVAECLIPEDLREAFVRAVCQTGPELADGRPEPMVMLEGKGYTVPAVCEFAECSEDRLPDILYAYIAKIAEASGQPVPQAQTYKAAAQTLRSAYACFRSEQAVQG